MTRGRGLKNSKLLSVRAGEVKRVTTKNKKEIMDSRGKYRGKI